MAIATVTVPGMQTGEDYWSQFQPVQATGPLTSSEGTGGITGAGGTGVSPIDTMGPIDQVTQNAASFTAPTNTEWNQQTFAQQFGTPRTPQELIALEGRLNQAGITVMRNASGVAGKIRLPNGQIVDIINSAGAGGNGFQWLTGDGGSGGGNNLASLGYNFGSSMAPWTEQFNAPTAEQAANSPGVQFGLDEAMRRMQNSAAAKGTLLNGRVQQAIGASNVGNAMQQYGDVYNRALGEYGLRRENFYNNQDRPFDKNYRLAALGRP